MNRGKASSEQRFTVGVPRLEGVQKTPCFAGKIAAAEFATIRATYFAFGLIGELVERSRHG